MKKLTVRGITVYTSDDLKNQLKEIIEKQSPNYLTKIYTNLVDKDKLVPIEIEKHLIQKLLNKIRRHKLSNIVGTLENKTMYVILHKFLSEKELMSIIVHESIHYVELINFSKFHSINFNIYQKFYEAVYINYLESDTYDKQQFTKFITKLVLQRKSSIIKESNYEFLFLAFKNNTRLDEKTLEKKMYSLWDYINKTIDNKYINHKYPLISNAIRKAYIELVNKFDYKIMVGQEIYNPGEIICILSELNIKHPNVVKTLSLLK